MAPSRQMWLSLQILPAVAVAKEDDNYDEDGKLVPYPV